MQHIKIFTPVDFILTLLVYDIENYSKIKEKETKISIIFYLFLPKFKGLP